MFFEKFKIVFVIPSAVPDFEYEGVSGEKLEKFCEIVKV